MPTRKYTARKRTHLPLLSLLPLLALPHLSAQPQTVRENSSDIAALRATQELQQDTIMRLKNRIDQLEQERTPAPAPAPVVIRENFDDTVPILAIANFEPDTSRGWLPLPRTGIQIRFNVKPRLDITMDTRDSGNPDRFVTALIPVKDSPDYNSTAHFNINTRGSQISFDARPLDPQKKFRLYYENDFYDGGVGAGMDIRIRQLYVQFHRFTAGFATSTFEDPDIWPDTVDYEGPNSAIFARWPLLRYTHPLAENVALNLSIEKPDTQIDTTNTTNYEAVNRMPDLAANVRWNFAKGSHVQLAGIVRELSADADIYGQTGNQTELGIGMNLSSVIALSPADALRLQFTYGDGLFRYSNDNFIDNDAAYAADGTLHAIGFASVLAAYTHRWSNTWRSTASYGWVRIDNKHSQSPDAYHATDYASLNIIYTPLPRLDVGAEVLYGRKEVKDGSTGDVWRFQVSVMYSLF